MIVLKDFGIRAEIVHQVLPRNRGRNQTMNEQDRNLVGIVWMNHIDARGEPRIIRPKKGSSSASCYSFRARIDYRQSRRVVGGDGTRSAGGSDDDGIERIIKFEERHFSSALLLDSRYSERNPAGRVVRFFRRRSRILREDHQRCPCSAYFEFVTETSLANRVCQEHLIGRGQVFERFRT